MRNRGEGYADATVGGGPPSGLGEDPAHFLVDDELGALRIRPAPELRLAQIGRGPRFEADRSERR